MGGKSLSECAPITSRMHEKAAVLITRVNNYTGHWKENEINGFTRVASWAVHCERLWNVTNVEKGLKMILFHLLRCDILSTLACLSQNVWVSLTIGHRESPQLRTLSLANLNYTSFFSSILASFFLFLPVCWVNQVHRKHQWTINWFFVFKKTGI